MIQDYTFKEYLKESLNTSFPIFQVINGNPEYHLLRISEYTYRIFIEYSYDGSKDIHVGFEILDDTQWSTKGMRDNLSIKELSGLFGTLLNILKGKDFNTMYICSDESLKHRAYLNMASKLSKNLNYEYMNHDDFCIMISKRKQKQNPKFKHKVIK